MIVCYAQGGGLGHLTRIRAYLHTVHGDTPSVVVTDSPFGADPRVLGPHHSFSGSLPAALREFRPETLVVDAFPAGVNGELSGLALPSSIRTVHLARLLRWEDYRPLMGTTRFDETWTLEELSDGHRAHLSEISGSVAPLELVDPPAEAGGAHGAWLIPHTGPPAEIEELIAYARECATLENRHPRLLVAAPHRPPVGVDNVDVYPVWPLFAEAERVISAAGFNVVRQMLPWRAKHRMLPFPRRWDDQFTRAARARECPRSDR
ncbi:hypothetical protein [Actinoplanes sp. HUAS TT8]|uniref:hypothetical protein n=1 Tax=Actinoplanes sp. HUAS TT8 TaxID=3447453 RepID=UPI003F527B3A